MAYTFSSFYNDLKYVAQYTGLLEARLSMAEVVQFMLWSLRLNTNNSKTHFLDALASLVLMIVTDSLTDRLEIDSPIPPKVSSLRLRL